jgi:hypothetical protein
MIEDEPVIPANGGTSPKTSEPQPPPAQQETAPAVTVASGATPANSSSTNNYEDAIKKGAGILLGALCMAGSTGAFFLYNLILDCSGKAPLNDIRFTIAVGAAWLLVGVAAFVLVRKQYRWFDMAVAVVELCFAAALGFFSWHVHKNFAVLDSRYAVGLFNFDDSDSSAQFYKDVHDKLYEVEKQHDGRFLLRPVPHNITEQESTDEQNRGLSGWGRMYGSHVAVWVRVTKLAPEFQAELRIMPVQDLGKPVNSLFQSYAYHSINLGSRDSAVNDVVNNILYFWGVALYQQGKCGDATQILETLPDPNAAYYAAVCRYDGALSSHDADAAFQRAEDDVNKAIGMPSKNAMEVAGYHDLLGTIHSQRLRTRITRDPEREFGAAVTELTTAAESYDKLGQSERSALVNLDLARAYYERRFPPTLASDLLKASDLFKQAIHNLAGEPLASAYASYSLTLSELAAYDGQNKASDCRLAEDQGRLAIDAAKKSTERYRTDLRSAVGAALGECAVILADRDMLRRAFDLLDQSLAAQRPGFESMVMRERYGQIVLFWAGAARETPDRYDVLERGATQFREAARGFRSLRAFAKSVESLRDAAQCHMLQAQQSGGDAQKSAANAAIQDLTDALQFASEAGIDQADLFGLRAKCYRQLAGLATDPIEERRLVTLALQDENAAKQKSTAVIQSGATKKK